MDVDECKNTKLCPRENEHCKNLPGFYSCKCDSGFTRKDGKCVKDEKPEKESDDVTEDDEDDDVGGDDVGDDDVDDDEADEADLDEAMHAEL
ncbi:cysteine-rich with EGF-like domain 1 isoform X1 [Paramuricea clavata]|uniref:Cysteine-rich with EGF-like domain 1 isoform X1 n=1 Tax=Paramuricea clavata TaxID=317549 RepID=A0A6S7HX35_PARCT|nr:cysteine-rich with EGF-like domain 1 isoform X1 [Paramuricea clavata]